MNVASLELCKRLYELSGWNDTVFVHTKARGLFRYHDIAVTRDNELIESVEAPAYDLGYLLRRLPGKLTDQNDNASPQYHLHLVARFGQGWSVAYSFRSGAPSLAAATADTPENAACKLAIQLFEQGVIKPEVRS